MPKQSITHMPMVTLLAKTEVTPAGVAAMQEFYDAGDALQWRDTLPGGGELMEFAGRTCYDANSRKNPATSTAEGYLANIMDQRHESVLEHVNLTFLLRDISRACSHEVVRHRHLSFSQQSQRFVLSLNEQKVVVPPAIYDTLSEDDQDAVWDGDLDNLSEGAHERIYPLFDGWSHYEVEYATLREAGFGRKEAAEAARFYVPNAAATEMVVTGNARSWKDFIQKRAANGADAEIRALADLILLHLELELPEIFGPEAREHWSNDNEQKAMK